MMLEQLKRQANLTYTENGALTHVSTTSACLDLFATVGALRGQTDDVVVKRFLRAYAENPDLAMKILFYARDVRGGLGERKVFRTILHWLADNEPASVRKNIAYIGEFGRYDDLLSLFDTACEADALRCIETQLAADLSALENGDAVSLLGKWLPSVNASNADTVRNAKRIARYLHMEDAAYRKTLTRLRAAIKLIENNLREKDYTFDYSKQPSKAMFKYRKAFLRNDGERYAAFLTDVREGNTTLHTGTLTPYDIIAPIVHGNAAVAEGARQALDVTWNAQADFTGGENALAVVDGSGSMYCGGEPLPAAVAQSLGIYFAERNTGAFHNHFITFSMKPRLVEIRGRDIVEKVRYCMGYNECSNTDLAKVFELILATAVQNRMPQSELPQTLYIISDMEFDTCARGADMTNFAYAKERYAQHGYKLPDVVFWNVNSRNEQQPVTQNEQGVALVSGCTPRIFAMLQSGILSPYAFMLEVLGGERYAVITA